MSVMQIVSIFLEVVVAMLGAMLSLSKKKRYGWFIALTFVLYIFYDLADLLALQLSPDALYLIFFCATLSILWANWNIYLEA